MLMNNFPWRRFKRASSQSMLSPLARVGKPTSIPLGVDPGLRSANFRVASGTTIPQMSGKKGFFGKMSPEELKDFKDAMAEMDFGVKQEFLGGVSPNPPPMGSFKQMAFDQTPELKKRREQIESLCPFLTA